MSRRFEVGTYGTHAWEIQDLVTRRRVCIVGLEDQTRARNRPAGTPAPRRSAKKLRQAQKIADALEAAYPRGELWEEGG